MEMVNTKINLGKYLEYKNSAVDWLGKIPSHWEVLTVKRLGKTKVGGTPSTSNLKFWDGNIPWIPSGKLQNCEINAADKFITESGLKYSATKLIKPNTTLVALTGATCANIGYLKFEACANQSVIAIEEYENVHSKFLYYALINERNQILLSQTGGAQAGINESDVNNVLIVTPTYHEQVCIAEFLDRKIDLIDQAIDIKQKQIELLQERRQILIHKAVTRGLNPNVKMKDSGVEWIGEIPEGWKIKRLKTVLQDGRDGIRIGPFGSSIKSEILKPTGFKIYGQEHVIEDNFNIGEKYIDISDFKRLSNYELFGGDIVITMMGTTGKSKVVPNNIQKGIMDSHLIRLRTKIKNANPEFVSFLINDSKYIFNQIKLRSKGSIMEGLNSSIVKSLHLLLPPLNEQKLILLNIEEINLNFSSAISLKEQEIEKLKEYKATLINSAVTGKIKVYDDAE